MDIFWPILKSIFIFMGIFFIMILLLAAPIVLHSLFYLFYQLIFKKRKLPKASVKSIKLKEPNFFIQLFYLFPRRFIEDVFTSDADAFPLHGINLIVGTQGKGKTITLVHYIRMLKHLYPGLKVFSNMSMSFSDGKIHSVDDLVSHSDVGKTGKVEVLDECQNWFNSNESRNFPPEMLGEICQQRKEYSLMLMTTQVYNNLVSQIKNQIDMIFNPITLLGCFTIVRVYKVSRDENGNITGQSLHKIYSFVHDDELRNCFNTREKIERLTKKGFKPKSEQLNSVDSKVS